MNVTEGYTRAHEAFVKVGRKVGLKPFAVRVLFAIAETAPTNDNGLSSERLEQTLGGINESSAVRRALLDLYAGDFAVGVAQDGGRRRRGVRSQVSLTEKGAEVADQVQQRLNHRV